MDTPKPMQQAMQEGKEDPNAIKLERISNSADFKLYLHQILKLKKNVLGTAAVKEEEEDGVPDVPPVSESAQERDVALDEMYEKYVPRSEKGELFVAVRNKRVVAFVALRKVEGPQNHIEVEEFRMAPGKQKGVFKQTMRQLMEEMKAQGFKHVIVRPTGGAESRFFALRREDPEFNYFKPVTVEGGKDVEIVEKEPEAIPQAA